MRRRILLATLVACLLQIVGKAQSTSEVRDTLDTAVRLYRFRCVAVAMMLFPFSEGVPSGLVYEDSGLSPCPKVAGKVTSNAGIPNAEHIRPPEIKNRTTAPEEFLHDVLDSSRDLSPSSARS